MTDYTYSIAYTDRFGNRSRIGMGIEEQMFATAVQLDKEGATLESAVREVWEITDGMAHFVRFEPYKNGKPITP